MTDNRIRSNMRLRQKAKILLSFFFLLLLNWKLSGASPYILKQIASDDELSHAWVTALYQDYLGFIWVGTSDGLYRYDGYDIKTYRSIASDTLTLAGNNISEIFEDSEHNLWIGTTRGLSRYDRDYDRFYYESGWPRENISDIEEGEGMGIFVGSYNGLFVYSYATESFSVYYQYSESGEPFEGSQIIQVLDKQKILISGPRGLDFFYIGEGQFTSGYIFPDFELWPDITEIIMDYKGTLWISTRDEGLFHIDPTSEDLKELIDPGNRQLFRTTLSLQQTADSVLWVGTENNGLCHIDLEKFYGGEIETIKIVSEDKEEGLLNNSVYSLMEDFQQNLWIGTYGGLNLYNPAYNNFHHVKTRHKSGGLSNDIVNAFFEDGNKIWIATEGGINILDRDKESYSYLQKGNTAYSLSSDAVYAMVSDPEGNIWIGTWGGGMNRYNPETGRIKVYRAEDIPGGGLSNNNIFSLTVDEKGIIWIGTMGGGLNRFNPVTETFKTYAHDIADPGSISNNWVRQVFLDSDNRLWVSTYNSLDIFDREKKEFIHFNYNEQDSSSLSDHGAIVIFEDSKQHIWVGTETGLNLFHEEHASFSVYSEEDGLPSNVINGILEDHAGNLWLSTNKGIAQFKSAIHLPENPEFSVFDINDGLQGNKFNRRSALKTSDGTLFFGGKNGFNSFKPEEIKANTLAPQVLITGFWVFNKKEVFPGEEGIQLESHITRADAIKLKFRYRVFTIHYVALNYIVPEKNQYEYMLEGFEEEWNQAGDLRSATYTNLDPGDYVFRVRASNNSSVWNEEGVELKITIMSPWYRTYWAYALYGLVILLIVLTYRRFILIRSHLKHELVLQSVEKDKIDQLGKMKSRFFTNISHEFRTPLTLILGPLDSLVSDINLKEKTKEKLAIIQKNARRMLRLINQLLDISEMEADHLKLIVRKGDVVSYVREIASLFHWLAVQRKINYKITATTENFEGYFDSDKIEKIIYNLLANAFKYTPDEGTISLNIDIIEDKTGEGQQLQILIKDSGVGISKEDKEKIFEHFYRSDRVAFSGKSGSGIGLALVRGLVGVYRGTVSLDSEPGSGTQFTIRLPLDREAFSREEIDEKKLDEIPLTVDIYDLEHGTEEPAEASAEGRKHKPQILIVEDNAEMRKHIADLLRETNQILEAENGIRALALCNDHSPDLIISDVRMPEMDGLELCRKIKSEQSFSHIPVLLLTAKARNEDRLEGVHEGADAYITKPFDNELLRATVRNLMESRQKMKEKYSRSVVVEPTEISITSVDEKLLKKAIRIVEENIANPDYSVDAFSKDIGMSRSHLHRKFVGLTGHSPSGFIRTLRMKRAALLLTKGQLTVSEILFEVGIKSRSYFTKSFKEQFGCSPTDFVAKNKENTDDRINLGH